MGPIVRGTQDGASKYSDARAGFNLSIIAGRKYID
jgi:hypothetical protein